MHPPDSASQTASQSVQLFLHSSLQRVPILYNVRQNAINAQLQKLITAINAIKKINCLTAVLTCNTGKHARNADVYNNNSTRSRRIIYLPLFKRAFSTRTWVCRFPLSFSSSICFRKMTFDANGTGLFSSGHITQPTVSKHWRKQKAPTSNSGLASSFLHLPLDCWWKWHCSLYAGSDASTSSYVK